jgi:DNA (cytosine-5)-methyltransferase 1
MKTVVTLFSGGGLKALGAKMAGYVPVGAVEYDANIASVYAKNLGGNIFCGRVEDVDYAQYRGVELAMFSPVCKRASRANLFGGECDLDETSAAAVCRFIEQALPNKVLVENVREYENFEAFKSILRTLHANGYSFTTDVVDAADYGVAQNRKRLIVRASRVGSVGELPEAESQACWFKAIEDLVPTFKVSKLAPWQVRRLPAGLQGPVLIAGGSAGKNIPFRTAGVPSFTIKANAASREPVRMIREDGVVVELSTRALARLQSLPDSYELPENKKLAGTIIGNGVPPMMIQKLLATF